MHLLLFIVLKVKEAFRGHKPSESFIIIIIKVNLQLEALYIYMVFFFYLNFKFNYFTINMYLFNTCMFLLR